MNRNKELIYRVVGDPIEIIKKVGDYLYGTGELDYERYFIDFVRLDKHNPPTDLKEWFINYMNFYGIELITEYNGKGLFIYKLYR